MFKKLGCRNFFGQPKNTNQKGTLNIMTDNNKFIPNLPKTFQVLELRDQQQPIKKSPLSAAARSKVVQRYGSNYLSEKEGYGPCSYSGCPYPNVP